MAFFDSALVLAYLDPDSGSMLLQLIAGGLAGAGVFLRYQWRMVSGYVFGLFGCKPASQPGACQTSGGDGA
jgi:hypothetical protein